MNISRRN